MNFCDNIFFICFSIIFRFWAQVDAVVTRSIINELLGDLAVARADIILLLRELTPASSNIPQRGAKSGSGSISIGDSTKMLGMLCGPVRRLVLFSAARLPLVERDLGLTQECYKSFKRCIGGILKK